MNDRTYRRHRCPPEEPCDYCERRAEAIASYDDWSLRDLDDQADYIAAKENGHPR